MLQTAQLLPPPWLSTLGFDPARFQTEPPACYRASWQLPGPDSHRGCWTSCASALRVSARRCTGLPPTGAWTRTRPSGCCSRWWRSGRWSRAASWPRPGSAGSRSPAGRVLRRRGLPGDGLPARRAGRDRRGDLRLGRAPAQPGPGHRLRGHHLHLLGGRRPPTSWPTWQREPEVDDGASKPVEEGGAPVRQLQGPPRRPAAGGDRDGGHPRRGPGAVLDLPRQRDRRHRDHPHGQGRPGRSWGCAGWCGWPTAGSPPPPTGPT